MVCQIFSAAEILRLVRPRMNSAFFVGLGMVWPPSVTVYSVTLGCPVSTHLLAVTEVRDVAAGPSMIVGSAVMPFRFAK